MLDKKTLLEWQRKLDPSNFNKARGAQYHTAPSVVFPDSPEYPKKAPKDSVTILFYIDSTMWIGELDRKKTVKAPEFIEKAPKARAKHGPVIVLDTSAALAAIPVNANYYWAAQVMSLPENKVIQAVFTPGKPSEKTGKASIKCVVTFVPGE